MQIHYVIQQQCELKANGANAFLRAMSTYTLVRDLEEGAPAWSQADTPRLRAALQLADPATMLEGLSVRLPVAARRAKDPADGWIDAMELLERARKVADRGERCADCAACVTTPDRFGCWGTLSLPADDPTLGWLLRTWRSGVTASGKVRLRHWLDRVTAASGGLRSAREALGFDNPADPHLRTPVSLPYGNDLLDAGELIRALATARKLDLRAMTELLADLHAVSWDQLKALGRHAMERQRLRGEGRKVSPDLDLAIIPFQLQPDEADGRGIEEWKSFLYACYMALHLGLEIELTTITAEDPLAGA